MYTNTNEKMKVMSKTVNETERTVKQVKSKYTVVDENVNEINNQHKELEDNMKKEE